MNQKIYFLWWQNHEKKWICIHIQYIQIKNPNKRKKVFTFNHSLLTIKIVSLQMIIKRIEK